MNDLKVLSAFCNKRKTGFHLIKQKDMCVDPENFSLGWGWGCMLSSNFVADLRFFKYKVFLLEY